jgi:hypothetical protein
VPRTQASLAPSASPYRAPTPLRARGKKETAEVHASPAASQPPAQCPWLPWPPHPGSGRTLPRDRGGSHRDVPRTERRGGQHREHSPPRPGRAVGRQELHISRPPGRAESVGRYRAALLGGVQPLRGGAIAHVERARAERTESTGLAAVAIRLRRGRERSTPAAAIPPPLASHFLDQNTCGVVPDHTLWHQWQKKQNGRQRRARTSRAAAAAAAAAAPPPPPTTRGQIELAALEPRPRAPPPPPPPGSPSGSGLCAGPPPAGTPSPPPSPTPQSPLPATRNSGGGGGRQHTLTQMHSPGITNHTLWHGTATHRANHVARVTLDHPCRRNTSRGTM